MFSESFYRYAEQRWSYALPAFGKIRPFLENRMTESSGDEQALLKLFCGTLPISDLASVPFDTLKSYARHAIFLRKNSNFSRELPEEIFLHFVCYPRINTEDLADCRPFFYEQLKERISDRSLGIADNNTIDNTAENAEKIVLEINRWCAEQMTYQQSDDRTENPLTAYCSGLGRCGEESTFAVTAFRSVGIPARQIYAPYWSHCDDNHAWVEVYVNGAWYFLGACEPEPCLNRAWFTEAASRALLICYRTYFDFAGKASWPDALIGHFGIALLYSVTERYADTVQLCLKAVNENGEPAGGANFRLEVMNMAAFRPLVQGKTDSDGTFTLRLGKGSIHIELYKDGLFAMEDFLLREDCMIEMVLTPKALHQDSVEIQFEAPAVSIGKAAAPDPALLEENSRIIANAAMLRKQRLDSYFLPAYQCGDPAWTELFRLAGGNAPQLFLFYQSLSADEQELAKAMLLSMAVKDYRDVTAEVLKGHFFAGKALLSGKENPEFSHFIKEVLNPRIQHEMLENWRPSILAAFSSAEQAEFREYPEHFMTYINAHYPDGNCLYYPPLSMLPSATLAVGHTDELGRRLLFVAGMRTFGVPARISPTDGTAEYWRGGQYHNVSGCMENAFLRLLPQRGKSPVYARNYALARWEKDAYQPLNYTQMPAECTEDDRSGSNEKKTESLLFPASSGEYRLTTVIRLPSGGQLCRLTYFYLREKENAALPLLFREASKAQMLCKNELDPFVLKDSSGAEISSDIFLRRKTVFLYPDAGKEPTEHILNEILAAAPRLSHKKQETMPQLVIVLRSKKDLENALLRKAIATVPEVTVLYDTSCTAASMLARKMFLEPGVWPLLLLVDETLCGCYGHCGYQVGIVDFVLDLAENFSA